MIIYGVAILAFCYVTGQLIGELLGRLIGIDANVGGVGFAMLLLIFLNDWFTRKGYTHKLTDRGIEFWSQMYIPIVVAMSAIQNVKVAVSSGFMALFAGIIPALICLSLIPALAKFSKSQPNDQHGHYKPVS
ncbi:malonate transporter subunit MadL [Spirosoma fluviale]|uniref:Malonate transporter, MadL subunit n=1 Tax=Spirosoma fluviale TaxID=1597977 RepID=A0A286FCL1_9BACT|nr:malonate transporter subunit MadL [Spirosoma fluviale]SOD80574.1 malonate transporter, MadL subunit [Spirosoma fluviale]